MNQRLRPEQRIRKRQAYQIIYEKGKFARGRWVNLWAYDGLKKKEDPNGPMIGIVVSRKTSLRANQRNLWKRRIRESFRILQVLIRKNVAVMVQSKKQEKVPGMIEIKEEMNKLLKATGCLK